MNNYERHKTAPTWLWNERGESELFETQEEVDQAWTEGWFAPFDNSRIVKVNSGALISDEEVNDLEDLLALINTDERYSGLKVNKRFALKTVIKMVLEYERDVLGVDHGFSNSE